MTDEAERFPLDILGRRVGTFSGWEDFGDMTFGFLDFKPDSSGAYAAIEACSCLSFSLETGRMQQTDGDGRVLSDLDIIESLVDYPYSPKKETADE